ncbi:hypothetical protein EH331_10595 [Enterococcus faecalis]|nr:hypothetical protein [Enterococcus faecalis]
MVLSLVLGDEIIYLHKETGNYSLKGTLGKSKKQDKRFVEKEKQFLNGTCYRIVVDVATGVNYLSTTDGGLTPLIDNTGNIVIDN